MPPVLKSFISKNGKKDESEGNIISNGLKCQENITQYCCFYWENRTQINCVYKCTTIVNQGYDTVDNDDYKFIEIRKVLEFKKRPG